MTIDCTWMTYCTLWVVIRTVRRRKNATANHSSSGSIASRSRRPGLSTQADSGAGNSITNSRSSPHSSEKRPWVLATKKARAHVLCSSTNGSPSSVAGMLTASPAEKTSAAPSARSAGWRRNA
ncbi:MAG: hypothetical protein IPJ61_09720 [Tessaracoccus sp.]|uniref:hypothetical protein n=1 Tax=Tessaracoccus sp. TaxID=1971211 RepID=UPI001ECF57DE|nr:hypothetical protein [Tessaracoccus sp.]MBK7821339.1 hypothetical protein [Tessaracoccus sp.]